jgi:ATP-binding cassette subfamily B protein
VGDKCLLIFDEATSALDSGVEMAIMQDIAELHGHATIVIIAHRLSTVRSEDSIVVLDAGRVAETGSWATLIAKRGAFYRLWKMQTEMPEATRGLAPLSGTA